MTENDIIAEYVKERYPFLINSFEFAVYRVNKRLEGFGTTVRKSIEKLIKDIREKKDEKDYGNSCERVFIDESACSTSQDSKQVHDTDSSVKEQGQGTDDTQGEAQYQVTDSKTR